MCIRDSLAWSADLLDVLERKPGSPHPDPTPADGAQIAIVRISPVIHRLVVPRLEDDSPLRLAHGQQCTPRFGRGRGVHSLRHDQVRIFAALSATMTFLRPSEMASACAWVLYPKREVATVTAASVDGAVTVTAAWVADRSSTTTSVLSTSCVLPSLDLTRAM